MSNAKDKEEVIENIMQMLSEYNDNSGENDNETFNNETLSNETEIQIVNRDAEYTKLLSHFVKVTKIRNALKEIFKWTFYAVVVSSIIVLIFITRKLFYRFLFHSKIEDVIDSIPLLITSFVGFVSVIITIPVTITKYLFSTKEDENITQIILHTQEHDIRGRQWTIDLKKTEKFLSDNNEDQNNNNNNNQNLTTNSDDQTAKTP